MLHEFASFKADLRQWVTDSYFLEENYIKINERNDCFRVNVVQQSKLERERRKQKSDKSTSLSFGTSCGN